MIQTLSSDSHVPITSIVILKVILVCLEVSFWLRGETFKEKEILYLLLKNFGGQGILTFFM